MDRHTALLLFAVLTSTAVPAATHGASPPETIRSVAERVLQLGERSAPSVSEVSTALRRSPSRFHDGGTIWSDNISFVSSVFPRPGNTSNEGTEVFSGWSVDDASDALAIVDSLCVRDHFVRYVADRNNPSAEPGKDVVNQFKSRDMVVGCYSAHPGRYVSVYASSDYGNQEAWINVVIVIEWGLGDRDLRPISDGRLHPPRDWRATPKQLLHLKQR